jgi:hypothetical protein
MKSAIGWAVAAVLIGAATSAEEPSATLTRGKLEADLGHHEIAAEAFAAVARDTAASQPQRWEALVRLAVARRDAGDARGSAAAFEEAFRTYGRDEEALRFLLQAAGAALPGRERWAEVWRKVVVEVDRRTPDRPVVRVTWPAVPFGLCPCSGTKIDFHGDDADIQESFRMFADVSGMNVVVHPGVQGRVTYHANQVPWDEVLERILSPSGFVARLQGNLVEIGHAQGFGPRRAFSGAPISFEYVSKELVETLREVAAHGHATVEVPEGVMGRVTIKLDAIPWDQAFDVLARVNGLAWTRTGDVIRVEPRRRSSS